MVALPASKWSYYAKDVLLKLNFEAQGHLYVNYYFHILFFYGGFLLFWFLSRSTSKDRTILTEF